MFVILRFDPDDGLRPGEVTDSECDIERGAVASVFVAASLRRPFEDDLDRTVRARSEQFGERLLGRIVLCRFTEQVERDRHRGEQIAAEPDFVQGLGPWTKSGSAAICSRRCRW